MKKYLHLFLAIFILLLSVVPEDNCDQEKNGEYEQTSQSEQDGCADCCSPFMSCCACFGFTSEVTPFYFKQQIIYIDKVSPLFGDITPSDFFDSIWQPPRIV